MKARKVIFGLLLVGLGFLVGLFVFGEIAGKVLRGSVVVTAKGKTVTKRFAAKLG